MPPAELTSADLAELRAAVAGRVFVSSDDGYAAAVTGFALAASYSVDVAVVALGDEDVREAVLFAGARGLSVLIQSTGHGAEGAVTGGMLIITSQLDDLSIDPERRIASIGAGVPWSAVIEAAGVHGLHPITGSAATVGAVGYTLGGGLGPLVRSHGVSSDWVRGFRVVLADGSLVAATAEENPDLFWALRGGKTGLGIVTTMDFELVPVPQIFGGGLIFAADDIERVLRGWIDWTVEAEPETTTSFAIVRYPDLEVIPAPLRGRTVAALRFADPRLDSEPRAAPLRALATAVLGRIGPMPTTAIAAIHNDPDMPTSALTRGIALDRADDRLSTVLLRMVGPDVRAPLIAAELRHVGSRARIDVEGGSAVGGRDAEFMLTLIAPIAPGLPFEVGSGFIDGVIAAVDPWRAPVTTINFAAHDGGADHPSWPEDIAERLAQVATTVDPSGMFARRN